MLAAAAGEATDSAASAASALVSDHGDSGYADIARLMLARLALEAGDSVEAERALNELLESTADPVMRQVARVRLAVIALKDGEPEKIRALSKAEAGEGFTSHFQELLGDALVASGDFDGAQQAYQEALRGVAPNTQAGRLITAKLNMTRKGDDG
jgi:predicted negative regulator of RcsB-dependent stress response